MMVKINSQNNELFRFVVIISLVLLMILFITRAYLSNKPAVDAVEFSMRQHNFSQTVSLIRGQWLLEGRPSSVDYSFYNNQGNVVKQLIFWYQNRDGRRLDYQPIRIIVMCYGERLLT